MNSGDGSSIGTEALILGLGVAEADPFISFVIRSGLQDLGILNASAHVVTLAVAS